MVGAFDCWMVGWVAGSSRSDSIPPRAGATPWPQNSPGASWRNDAIETITQSSRRQWKKLSGYHRRSLVENLTYRLKTLTGNCLWARRIGSQATEVSIPGGRAQPDDRARTPSVRSHRLNDRSPEPLCHQIRFMQQRPSSSINGIWMPLLLCLHSNVCAPDGKNRKRPPKISPGRWNETACRRRANGYEMPLI